MGGIRRDGLLGSHRGTDARVGYGDYPPNSMKKVTSMPIDEKIRQAMVKEAFKEVNEYIFHEMLKNPFIKAVREAQGLSTNKSVLEE